MVNRIKCLYSHYCFSKINRSFKLIISTIFQNPYKMKKSLFFLFAVILISACSKEEKTDEYLLNKDKEELKESLKSYDVALYKYIKISTRASIVEDSISEEFQQYQEIFEKNAKLIENTDQLSVTDYISIYRDYKKVEGYIHRTDEDIFPTLNDYYDVRFQDSIYKKPFLTGIEKALTDNYNHAMFSVIMMITKDFGRNISLYECYETDPRLLPDSEIKSLLQYFRGLMFSNQGLSYIAEDEFSRNIEWLNNNKGINLYKTKFVLQWWKLNDRQTYIAYHALNHLFRGVNRLMMDREIDHQRAIEDFEAFIKDANEVGLDNELLWAIETYVYLHNGEKEKAIKSLTKLKSSDLLSSSDKKLIDESIDYIKDRDGEALLTGAYDKYFLSKIASKFLIDRLSKVDWRKFAKEQNISHVEELFNVLDKIKRFNDNLKKYVDPNQLDEIKEKSNKLWDKVKEISE